MTASVQQQRAQQVGPCQPPSLAENRAGGSTSTLEASVQSIMAVQMRAYQHARHLFFHM